MHALNSLFLLCLAFLAVFTFRPVNANPNLAREAAAAETVNAAEVAEGANQVESAEHWGRGGWGRGRWGRGYGLHAPYYPPGYGYYNPYLYY